MALETTGKFETTGEPKTDKHIEIAVIGGLFMDRIGQGATDVQPDTSTPGQIVMRPGGVAANVASILAHLGRQVALAGALGRDTDGDHLLAIYQEEGLATEAILRLDAPTGQYLALHHPDGRLGAAIADAGATDEITTPAILAKKSAFETAPVWLFDANLPSNVLSELMDYAKGQEKTVAIDCVSIEKAKKIRKKLEIVDILFCNRAECLVFANTEHVDDEALISALLERGVGAVIMTCGAEGLKIGTHEGLLSRKALSGPVVDVTGAGDAVIAAVLAAKTEGKAWETAADWAVKAAALAVSQRGCNPSYFNLKNIMN